MFTLSQNSQKENLEKARNEQEKLKYVESLKGMTYNDYCRKALIEYIFPEFLNEFIKGYITIKNLTLSPNKMIKNNISNEQQIKNYNTFEGNQYSNMNNNGYNYNQNYNNPYYGPVLPPAQQGIVGIPGNIYVNPVGQNQNSQNMNETNYTFRGNIYQ